MALKRLQLTSYRNLEYLDLSFTERVVCLIGRNGVGKTNIVDAVHILALTRSYFSSSDQQIIPWSGDFYRVEGHFSEGNVAVRYRDRKQISFKGKDYDRLTEHVGRFPVVVIAPDDLVLINGYSADRRKWLDAALCQIDVQYMNHLAHYNKILKQRNAYLKSLERPHHADSILLDGYDAQMSDHGGYIRQRRKTFCDELNPYLHDGHQRLSIAREKMSLEYSSDTEELDLATLWLQTRDQDLILRRTSRGMHRDDLTIKIDNHRAKDHGSQGQKKTVLFSIQLALAELMYDHLKKKPYLLLDDIFDKLDPDRVRELIRLVEQAPFEQIFMTDAHPERLKDALDVIPLKYQWIPITSDDQLISHEKEK